MSCVSREIHYETMLLHRLC